MAEMPQPAVQPPKPESRTTPATGKAPGKVIPLPTKRAELEEEQVAVLWFFSM